jgi:hypothetical protein
MLQNTISKETIRFMAEEFSGITDEKTLEHGLEHWNKGLVENVTSDQAMIHAEVHDSQTCRVQLDTDFLLHSSCTCEHEELCEHIAAVFFYVYGLFYDPRAYMESLSHPKQRNMLQDSPAPQTAKRYAVQETDSAEEWLSWVADQYTRHMSTNPHRVFSNIKNEFTTLLKSVFTWQEEPRQLYTLYAVLFLLHKAEEEKLKPAYSDYYHRYQYLDTVEELVKRLFYILQQVNLENMRRKHSAQIKPFINLLSKVCFPEAETTIDWISIYRGFWNTLLRRSDWFVGEQQRLTKELEIPGHSRHTTDLLLLARAHFAVHAGHDHEALAIWRKEQFPEAKQLISYLYGFYRTAQWTRLHSWLQELAPYLLTAGYDDFQFINMCWVKVVQELEVEDEWVEILRSFLPKRSRHYTNYLLEIGRFEEWIDFHLSLKISPYEIDKEDLRRVEKYNPALLLPLYHQSAERLIQEKNRAAYKEAVKLFKKLRMYYKRLKKQQLWDTYIPKFRERHIRLRALQDELKKGGIIE